MRALQIHSPIAPLHHIIPHGMCSSSKQRSALDSNVIDRTLDLASDRFADTAPHRDSAPASPAADDCSR
jgi:hypothetical protein